MRILLEKSLFFKNNKKEGRRVSIVHVPLLEKYTKLDFFNVGDIV